MPDYLGLNSVELKRQEQQQSLLQHAAVGFVFMES
jgi:hypothetical protein